MVRLDALAWRRLAGGTFTLDRDTLEITAQGIIKLDDGGGYVHRFYTDDELMLQAVSQQPDGSDADDFTLFRPWSSTYATGGWDDAAFRERLSQPVWTEAGLPPFRRFWYDGAPTTRHTRNVEQNPAVTLTLESGIEVVIVEGSSRATRADPEQLGALRRPVARGSGAVVLAGEHDERGLLLCVPHRGVIDRHLLAGSVGEVLRDAALGARRELVAQADVRERAAHHHLVVAAPGPVGVEVDRLDASLPQVRPGR